MAYDYKSIGNTAAKVVSLLAVAGGLLWWQRTTTPVDIPRPQDEAEIMTAVLERHYAMGRTNTQFTKTYSNNISFVITNVDTSGGTVQVSSSLQSGDDYYVSFNGTSPTYFPHNTVATMTGAGAYRSFTMPDTRGVLTLRHYTNLYWRTDTDSGPAPNRTFWRSSGDAIPQTLLPYAYINSSSYTSSSATARDPSVCGTITLSKCVQYAYITNSPAHTDTNTINFFPNATFQYPAAIRSAIAPGIGAYGTSGACQWILPSNTFMTSGVWDGDFSSVPTTYLYSNAAWWTNWVTVSSLRTSITNTIYWADTNSIALFARTNYIYNPPEAPWLDILTNNGVPPYLMVSRPVTNISTVNVSGEKLFSFERDQKPLYWSTNAYNDMARALSLMQWQRNECVSERQSITQTYRANRKYYWDGSQWSFMPDQSTSWWEAPSTNVAFDGYIFTPIGEQWSAYHMVDPDEYVTQTVDYRAVYTINTCRFRLYVTNVSCFAWNGRAYLQAVASQSGYASNYPTGFLSLNWGDGKTWVIDPSCGYVSDWWCGDVATGAVWDAIIDDAKASVETAAAAHIAFLEGNYPTNAPPLPYPGFVLKDYSWSSTNNTLPADSGIRGWSEGVIYQNRTNTCAYYRVQFLALTNYLNHAPVR